MDLIVGFRIHEDEAFFLIIEIPEILLFSTTALDRFARKAVVIFRAGLNVRISIWLKDRKLPGVLRNGPASRRRVFPLHDDHALTDGVSGDFHKQATLQFFCGAAGARGSGGSITASGRFGEGRRGRLISRRAVDIQPIG
ncbi:MAG: hypothetical protein R3C42_09295 [Parvularculaceae bacterium]